jgi:hypothetical protein
MGVFRRKLPELALEAASVVFAVLVALAVDGWREDRANEEIARQAIRSIATEIRGNRDELQSARNANMELMRTLEEAAGASGLESLDVRFEYSLLAAAAWQTAQVTRAVHFMEFGTVQRIARLYHLQALFEEGQRGMLDLMSGMAEILGSDADRVPGLLLGRLQVVMELERGLSEAYDSVLEELEGA